MKFENTKETKEILEKMYDIMMSIAPEEKRLEKELQTQDDITQDLLHEIELADLNAIERTKIYCQLRKNRKERRKIKDTLSFIGTLKGFQRRFVEKGMLSETNQVIKNIDTHNEKLKTREYKPRVLENLRCARGKEEKQ